MNEKIQKFSKFLLLRKKYINFFEVFFLYILFDYINCDVLPPKLIKNISEIYLTDNETLVLDIEKYFEGLKIFHINYLLII